MLRSLTLALFAVSALARLAVAAPIVAQPVDADWWRDRHAGLVAQASHGNVDVLFLGDSITDYWRGPGATLWAAELEPLGAGNFGIGGDKVENVLWRIENGELQGISPKAVVLLIGTNNLFDNSIAEIEDGHRQLVRELRKRLPQAKLLLLGIFPRVDAGPAPATEIPQINRELSTLADHRSVYYLDFGAKFLSPDGSISTDIMADGLHPTAKGYEIWIEQMMPTLNRLLGI